MMVRCVYGRHWVWVFMSVRVGVGWMLFIICTYDFMDQDYVGVR